MDQINIWSNAPENHREGRDVSGDFCVGLMGGGAVGWFSDVLKPTHLFFLWRTPDWSLLRMKKVHLLCGGTCFLVTGKRHSRQMLMLLMLLMFVCSPNLFFLRLSWSSGPLYCLTFNFTCHPLILLPFPIAICLRRLMVTSQTWEVLSEMFFSEKKIPTDDGIMWDHH